ncbi:MAG: aminopeptidase, partial [Traorella sp.]
MENKNAWLKYEDKQVVFDFNENYKKFISDCKTERECVTRSIQLARECGYRSLDEVIEANETLKAGDKVYVSHMGKTLALYHLGSEPFEKGLNILGAHIDSPRIDIKQNPLYEDHDIVLLDTHYYGGIKKYQWVALPLALHGVVVKKDGTVVNVVIGEEDCDPVVSISDLLVHLAADQMSKTAAKVIEGEDLNVTVGSIPVKKEEDKSSAKDAIIDLLKEKYGIEEENFKTAELEVVPAGKARDLGLDCSLVIGYGHDDRVCAYTSLMALLDSETPTRTSVCLLTDKEEVGSIGATG